ncbi:hypothetical protein HK096_003838, partial [Nowakowskiella sp. JEL0078]
MITTNTGITCLQNGDILFKLIGFDPHQDIPIEMLHTLLLGLVKYMMQVNVSGGKLNGKNLDVLMARYNDFSFDCFTYRSSPASVKQYTGSFVGKDYKCFIQIAPFLLDGLISSEDLLIW